MSSFEEFMNEVKALSTKALPTSNTTVSAIQLALQETVNGLLAPIPIASGEQNKFSEKVSGLVQDKDFISEFSNQIGDPLEHESEDKFVKRGSKKLRQMLYKIFDVRA